MLDRNPETTWLGNRPPPFLSGTGIADGTGIWESSKRWWEKRVNNNFSSLIHVYLLILSSLYLSISSVFLNSYLYHCSVLTNSQDRSFAADAIMGNRNTHSYNLDPIDQDALPSKKLMAKNFLGSGMTYQ